MSARLTHLNLDLLDLTIGANPLASYLGVWRNVNLAPEVATVEGRAAGQRYALAIPAKKRYVFSGTELLTSTLRQTNLNVTAFSVGGTAFLSRLRSGQVNITTEIDEGSGLSDEFEFPNAVGTSMEITAEMFVTNNPTLVQTVNNAGTSGLLVDVSIALGGTTITAPMTLTAASHRIEAGAIQMEDCTFRLRGVPTVATGSPIIATILLGQATLAWSYRFWNATTDGTFSGTGLITAANLSFGEGALIEDAITVTGTGAYTDQVGIA